MSIYEVGSDFALDRMYVSLYKYCLWYVSISAMNVALDWKLTDWWDCVPPTWCKRPSLCVCVVYCYLLLVNDHGDWMTFTGANVHMKKLPKSHMFHNLEIFLVYKVFQLLIFMKANIEENWCGK